MQGAGDRPPSADDNHAAVGGEQSGGESALKQLQERRSKDSFSSKLAIGPGDVIEVTVPEVPELDKFKIRVSEDDTVALPLAGVIKVDGMTEDDLRDAIYRRLKRPIKNPEVEVFVDEYQSREVAVVGMVQKPGLYSIASRADTVLDMVNRAGGMTAEASSRVLFVPGSSLSSSQRSALLETYASKEASAETRPVQAELRINDRQSADPPDRVAAAPLRSDGAAANSANQPQLASLLGTADPIEVDLRDAARERDLDVQVRPGDTIIVPAAGEVMVDGWVQNPGAFRIVPGMTALSAVSAAGGALFSHTAAVLRNNPDGSRSSIPVDLAEVKEGAQPDVPVEAGDVVFVQRSSTGAVPYLFYELFTKFGTGMVLPVP